MSETKVCLTCGGPGHHRFASLITGGSAIGSIEVVWLCLPCIVTDKEAGEIAGVGDVSAEKPKAAHWS